jgi:NAD(P)-dependent dehydrogenase (short-subunit alcohol dehydrogenase family)
MLAGRDADGLRQRAAELGGDIPSVIVDLTQPHHAPHAVSTAVATLGGLDGVVNAAGVVAFGSLEDTTDDTIDELAAADFTGPLRVMREALRVMDGGFFVNITGVVAEQPMAGISVYSAVKAGLSAATVALGREVRRAGVHVLDARPPHTETGLADRPIAGTAPSFPEGLDPKHVATTIVEGLAAGRRELSSEAFHSRSK